MSFAGYPDGPYIDHLTRRTAEGKPKGSPAQKVAEIKSGFPELLEVPLPDLNEWDFRKWR